MLTLSVDLTVPCTNLLFKKTTHIFLLKRAFTKGAQSFWCVSQTRENQEAMHSPTEKREQNTRFVCQQQCLKFAFDPNCVLLVGNQNTESKK